MSNDDQMRTEDYARGILEDLRALEELADYGDVSELEGEELEEMSPSAREYLRELVEEHGTRADGLDPVTAYVESALELVVHEERRPGEDRGTLSAVELLVTFGGPNARVTVRAREEDRAYVDVAWGSSSASVSAYVPNVAGRLLELAEMF